MEHKEEPCDHMSHCDADELDGLARSLCGAAKMLVQTIGGTPADWATALAMAALAARMSAQLQENRTPTEVLAFIDENVERSKPTLELALAEALAERDTERYMSPGSKEAN